jgi:L-rhamnonate dehydratase
MKITKIEAMRLNRPPHELKTKPRRPAWAEDAEVANPMSRYPKVKRHRNLWTPRWETVWCKVTVEDGTWGLGSTTNGRGAGALSRTSAACL